MRVCIALGNLSGMAAAALLRPPGKCSDLSMIRLTESAATHGCNCLHEMLALVEYEFLIVCMYSLRACILSCALCADPLEVGCGLALLLREMRIYVRRVSSESAIVQNIRVANSNRN